MMSGSGSGSHHEELSLPLADGKILTISISPDDRTPQATLNEIRSHLTDALDYLGDPAPSELSIHTSDVQFASDLLQFINDYRTDDPESTMIRLTSGAARKSLEKALAIIPVAGQYTPSLNGGQDGQDGEEGQDGQEGRQHDGQE